MHNQPQAQDQSPQPGPDCPPEDQLIELAAGRLAGPVAQEVRAHAEHCPSCSMFLIGLSDTASGSANAPGSSEGLLAGNPGQFVAEFRLLRPLGHGAMGEVFLARDTFLDRLVAVKFLTTGETSTSARERFYVEARAVARLQHPNVVTLYRAGEENGRRYLVSEYVRGQSLERLSKPLPWKHVVEIGLGLSRGLAAAHQRGVLHRDVKPANVMMTKGGEVKILDFGLAKLIEVLPGKSQNAGATAGQPVMLSASQQDGVEVANLSITRSGALLGTPLYMAPEIWRSETATTQTDVYSLGALLFELCSGRPPHHAENALALGFRVTGNDAPLLASVVSSVDTRLAKVVDRCLQRDPSKRFASGNEVRDALEQITAKGPSVSRGVAIFVVSVLLAVLATVAGVAFTRDRQAKKQAELAQRLGEEISTMEWLLRSARQLPLHDLGQEKDIVRKRMAELQTKLKGYGELGTGLAHYALGRGHMALHEYPQALSELQLAIQSGNQSAEVHYALGFVLGKHFEQAIYEARLAGGGEFAQAQIRELTSKYLQPAVRSLENARAMQLDAPQYLEALISFYRHDYEDSLKHIEVTLKKAPWLYEAMKLSADIHHERALTARDSGSYEVAELEFGLAVRDYQKAAEVGRSDSEIYEGLAETWIRQIEMAANRTKPFDRFFQGAMEASNSLAAADSQSPSGSLKRAFALLMTMHLSGSTQISSTKAALCVQESLSVLAKQPDNPYAREVYAMCNRILAEIAINNGNDPVPLFQLAIAALEPALKRNPRFLWGINDLSTTYAILGEYLQSRGHSSAKETLEKALHLTKQASALDPKYLTAPQNSLYVQSLLVSATRTTEELRSVSLEADSTISQCATINPQFQQCYVNYFQVYARAASRMALLGQDPQSYLTIALDNLATSRKLGGTLLDVEQNAALSHLTVAREALRKVQDPDPALAEMQDDLKRCFAVSAQDATCETLAAKAAWVQSDWRTSRGQQGTSTLEGALAKAVLATQSPEANPDAWQTLAETYLRLARAGQNHPQMRDAYLEKGLSAAQKIYEINPNHALGRATEGALRLLVAQSAQDPTVRQQVARKSVQLLELAIKLDPFLSTSYEPLTQAARQLANLVN